MGKTPPGETRQKVFAFVRERLLAGRPPTVREVQEALGFRAVQTAHQHLEALVAEGRLAADRGVARGYRLPVRGSPPVLVPILGRVPAGPLDTAVEDREGYLAFQAEDEAEGLFALRVKGESMRDAGILPGDLVVVRRQPTARDGEVVVALVGDEATVKRFRLRRGRPELHAENPAFAPLTPDPAELQILGVVIELRRRM
ncbi:MAG: transcriptional repressor LexA [Deferrisomatales bacterium]|nr:transcriptional repressor LexA [Deferrisomatales bacterium]